MKKALLLLTIVLIAGFSVFSQNLTLSDGAHNVPNGDTIMVAGDVTSTLFCHINVINNAGVALSVKCIRTNVVVVPGSTNTFCWGGSCWDTSYYISPDPTIIAAGETSTEFSGDYKANGHSGISIVRYRFYDMNNVSDSVMFYGLFDATVGINELPQLTVSDIYPNPADNAAFLNYNITSNFTKAEIRIIDILGNKAQIIPLNDREGKVKISTANLTSGIYFYSAIIDDKPVFTKKLIVRHK
jgi:hypothetical protein